MYVYIYIYLIQNIHARTHAHTHTHMYTYAHMYTYIHTSIHTCNNTHVYMCIHYIQVMQTHSYTYAYIQQHIYRKCTTYTQEIHTCMYTYIHVSVDYSHTSAHVFLYMHVAPSANGHPEHRRSAPATLCSSGTPLAARSQRVRTRSQPWATFLLNVGSCGGLVACGLEWLGSTDQPFGDFLACA